MKRKEFENAHRKSSSTTDKHYNIHDGKDFRKRYAKEEAFYQSLDETLKRKYEEYYVRKANEMKKENDPVKTDVVKSESQILIVASILIFFVAMNTIIDDICFRSTDRKDSSSPTLALKKE